MVSGLFGLKREGGTCDLLPPQGEEYSSSIWWQSFAFLGKCIGNLCRAAKWTRCGQFVSFLRRAAENELYLRDFLARCRCQSNSHENAEDAATCQMCVWYFAKHKLVTILLAAEKNTKQSSEHMHSFLLSRSKQPLSHSLIFQIVTNCSSLSSSELSWPSTRSVIHLFCTRC